MVRTNEWHRPSASLVLTRRGAGGGAGGERVSRGAVRQLARRPLCCEGWQSAEARANRSALTREVSLRAEESEQLKTLERVRAMLKRLDGIDIDEEGVGELHEQRQQLEERLRVTRLKLSRLQRLARRRWPAQWCISVAGATPELPQVISLLRTVCDRGAPSLQRACAQAEPSELQQLQRDALELMRAAQHEMGRRVGQRLKGQ